jgi:hypothetical protein
MTTETNQPRTNPFEKILKDAQEERIKRKLQRQAYSDYWQTKNQDLYPQKPTIPFTPQADVKPPMEQREWIRRRIKEVLQDE